jgi:hypothetical protein
MTMKARRLVPVLRGNPCDLGRAGLKWKKDRDPAFFIVEE